MADDQVVEHPDVHQAQRVHQDLGDLPIGPTGFGNPRGMVVSIMSPVQSSCSQSGRDLKPSLFEEGGH